LVPRLEQGRPEDLIKKPILLFGSDPKGYLAFQQALFAGGFYGDASPKSIPWGADPNGSTANAWKRVLIAAQQAQAAGLGLTPDDILARGVQGRKAADAGMPASKAPLVIQTTDPAVLSGLVQQAAQAALGRNLDPGEVQKFITSFHMQEEAYSRQRYKAEQDASGTGATYRLSQPDASADAQKFVGDAHPTEAGANDLADYVGVIHSLLNRG
jgi:hypothetical protein